MTVMQTPVGDTVTAMQSPVGESLTKLSITAESDSVEPGAWQAGTHTNGTAAAITPIASAVGEVKRGPDYNTLPAVASLFKTPNKGIVGLSEDDARNGRPKAEGEDKERGGGGEGDAAAAKAKTDSANHKIPDEKAWQVWRTLNSPAESEAHKVEQQKNAVTKEKSKKGLSGAMHSLTREYRKKYSTSSKSDTPDADGPNVVHQTSGEIVSSPRAKSRLGTSPTPPVQDEAEELTAQSSQVSFAEHRDNLPALASEKQSAAGVKKGLHGLKASPSMLFSILKTEAGEPAAKQQTAEHVAEREELLEEICHGGDLETIFKTLAGALYIDHGRLQSLGPLGEGGFASVERALYKHADGSSEEVAVKRLKPDLLGDPSDIQEFLEEANLLRKLRHEGIVKLRGLGCTDFSSLTGMQANMFVVQELMYGGSLKDLVVEQQKAVRGQRDTPGLAYSAESALDWCIQIADAIAYMHACRPVVIHRDIKTENVLLTHTDPKKAVAKVADLGLHKRMNITIDGAAADAADTSYYGGSRYYDGSKHGSVHSGVLGGSRHGVYDAARPASAHAGSVYSKTGAYDVHQASRMLTAAANTRPPVGGPLTAAQRAAAASVGLQPAAAVNANNAAHTHASSGAGVHAAHTHASSGGGGVHAAHTHASSRAGGNAAHTHASSRAGGGPLTAAQRAAAASVGLQPAAAAAVNANAAHTHASGGGGVAAAHTHTHASGAAQHAHTHAHAAQSGTTGGSTSTTLAAPTASSVGARRPPRVSSGVSEGGADIPSGLWYEGGSVHSNVSGSAHGMLKNAQNGSRDRLAISHANSPGGSLHNNSNFVMPGTGVRFGSENGSVHSGRMYSSLIVAANVAHTMSSTPLEILTPDDTLKSATSAGAAVRGEADEGSLRSTTPRMGRGAFVAAAAATAELRSASADKSGTLTLVSVPGTQATALDTHVEQSSSSNLQKLADAQSAADALQVAAQRTESAHGGRKALTAMRSADPEVLEAVANKETVIVDAPALRLHNESASVPANIRMMEPDATHNSSVVGVSTRNTSMPDCMTTATCKVGSLMYMAPEVMIGHAYNESVDMFSFAVLMFELFKGVLNMRRIALIGDEEEVMRYAENVAKGFREPLPVWWPEELRQLISQCWSHSMIERPTFAVCLRRLRAIKAAGIINAVDDGRPAPYSMSKCECGCTVM